MNKKIELGTPYGTITIDSSDITIGGELPKLARDLGSFNNMDTAPILENLNAGLMGDLKALLPLGTRLPMNASLEKRYKSLLEQTENAHGDYERNIDSQHNVERQLRENWKMFKENMRMLWK